MPAFLVCKRLFQIVVPGRCQRLRPLASPMTGSASNPIDGACTGSGAGSAADIDHVAIPGGGILVDEAGDQNAAVEGNNLAILLAAGRAGRTDIVLAARGALQPQFLRRRLVSQMHDHAAGGAGADDIRLLALRLGLNFGAGAVIGILERCETPAADNLVRAE